LLHRSSCSGSFSRTRSSSSLARKKAPSHQRSTFEFERLAAGGKEKGKRKKNCTPTFVLCAHVKVKSNRWGASAAQVGYIGSIHPACSNCSPPSLSLFPFPSIPLPSRVKRDLNRLIYIYSTHAPRPRLFPRSRFPHKGAGGVRRRPRTVTILSSSNCNYPTANKIKIKMND
jgi:hypothetical protein